MGRWQRYWFADGGRLALAIVRICVAVAVLLTLAKLAGARPPTVARFYRPVGVWMLLGHTAPPALLVSVLWGVAWSATLAMLLGIATRASTALSFIGTVALVSLSFSASPTWSHQYNVVCLAHCALLGARAGDTLSLDAWLRSRRGRVALDVARGYQWSLRLVQLAVALMFAGAAFHKLAHGHFTLRWALSDNLRHHLLVRFDLAGLDRPAIVDWVLGASWRYRTAAMLNLLAQATPIFAVFFVRRPLVRALGGLMFIVETLMLGVVVDLWNLHWLPLVAVFIDWEALLRRPRSVESTTEATTDAPVARGPRVYVAAFVAYELVTAFIPTLDQRLNTYPFSSFPMFATIRAREPFSEHLPYSLVGGTFDVISDAPIDPRAQRWVDHTHRTFHAVRNPDELHRKLATALERMQHFYPDYHVRGLRLWVTVFETAAYPAPAKFEPHRIAVLGEITADGTFRTMLGRFTGSSLEVRPANVALSPDAQLVYYRDDLPSGTTVPAPLVGASFDLASRELPGNPRYFVVVTDGTPWLVASHETWEWK